MAYTESAKKAIIFQSTLPMRGETHLQRYRQNWERFQSTLPMRGETIKKYFCFLLYAISIHSPHAGRDLSRPRKTIARYISIHSPHAGRDPGGDYMSEDYPISIHSHHAGRDSRKTPTVSHGYDFNPLSPCGERHFVKIVHYIELRFQSTLPMRGETVEDVYHVMDKTISIHSPHAGRDCSWCGRS